MTSNSETAVTIIEGSPDIGWSTDSLSSALQRSSLDSTSRLVIGIDFGTTYTGVAFAHSTTDLKGTRVNSDGKSALDAVVEKITVVKNWPNASQQYTDKTPSIIAYEDGRPVAWGGQVKATHETKIKCFKLGLQEGAGQHYEVTDAASLLGGFINDCDWKHPDLPQKTAADIAADYLALVVEFVNKYVLKDQFGETFLKNQQISYALTVPAIWSDKARDVTRRVAQNAGIPKDRLILITEPEAAAQYCATTCMEVSLQAGDHFLVCDAGGGTVDLIAYKICSLDPFEIEECSVGTGATCGAMYLNQGFMRLLYSKFGPRAEDILTPRRRAEASRCFETSIKCQFNPLAPGCDEEYEIPIPGAEDMLSVGLEDGYLTLSKADIDSIFEPIFQQVHELVKNQITGVYLARQVKFKTVFMVGGFGSNQYLSEFLKSKLPPGTELKRPALGWTAITRGAVLHMLGLSCVRERIMRRHYGFPICRLFREGHDQSRKIKHRDGLWYCHGLMEWYAKKESKMADGHFIKKTFFVELSETQYGQDSFDDVSYVFACEDDLAPEYISCELPQICSLTVDLKQLPPHAFTRKIGPLETYWEVEYELGMRFGTVLEFELIFDGKVVGQAVANYV